MLNCDMLIYGDASQQRRTGGLAMIRFLVFVIVALVGTGGMVSAQSLDSGKPSEMAENPQQWQQGPKLKVLSRSCSREYGYIYIQGEVQNMSGEKLDNVEAVGIFRTAGGDLVKSEDALLEYNPILPGQRSPFKVGATDNPEIKRCNVSFKFLLGGEEIEVTADPAPEKHKK
jgi:hypothetical protein